MIIKIISLIYFFKTLFYYNFAMKLLAFTEKNY